MTGIEGAQSSQCLCNTTTRKLANERIGAASFQCGLRDRGGLLTSRIVYDGRNIEHQVTYTKAYKPLDCGQSGYKVGLGGTEGDEPTPRDVGETGVDRVRISLPSIARSERAFFCILPQSQDDHAHYCCRRTLIRYAGRSSEAFSPHQQAPAWLTLLGLDSNTSP